MKLSVNTQRITVKDPFMLVTGTTGVYKVEFDISSDLFAIWDNLTIKMATFKKWKKDKCIIVGIDENNSCPIPAEMLVDTEGFSVGLFGVAEGIQYPTIWSNRLVPLEGCEGDGDEYKPTETIWDKIVEAVEGAEEAAIEAKNAAEEASRLAENAVEVAGNAYDTSTEAKELAEGSVIVSNEAKTMSEEAITVSNEAKELAESADSTANEAKIMSEDANTKAQTSLDKSIATEQALSALTEVVDTKVDKSVMQNTPVIIYSDITADPTKAVITHNKKNIVTGETSSEDDNLPIADTSKVGLMTPEQVETLENIKARVEALEGQTIRLMYTAKDNPTKEEINAFVSGLGYSVDTFGSIAVVIAGTYHIWHYYSNNSEWKDDGLDTVEQADSTKLGIVKGTSVDGKIFVESDGTMSLNGYDNINTSITNLSNNKADKSDVTALSEEVAKKANSDDVYDKATVDQKIAEATPEDYDEYKAKVDILETSKQDTLISGTNIKTVNGQSLLGEGDIDAGHINEVKVDGTVLEIVDKAVDIPLVAYSNKEPDKSKYKFWVKTDYTDHEPI